MFIKRIKIIFTIFCVSFYFIITNIFDTHKDTEYPQQAIQIILLSTAGGGTDLFMRQLAPLLEKELGQSIVLINQPGGNGNIAANTLIKSKNDGYTLAFLGEDVLGLNYLNFTVTYEFDDLLPISLLAGTPFGFYAHGESKWNNFHDVVKTAKEENRPIKIATFDVKTRYVLDSLAKSAGIEFIYIPSQSAATTLTAVLGKHAELGAIGSAFSSNIVAGKAKLLGSISQERFEQVPDVPTVLEQGFDFHAHTSNIFLYAPKGTPEHVLIKIEETLAKIVPTEDYKKVLGTLNFVGPKVTGREEAKKLIKSAYDFAMKEKAEKE